VKINIKQHQEQQVFQFPLEIEISGNAGQSLRKTIQVNAREQSVSFELPFQANHMVLDPDTWLLYELRKL
jgi:aminopeptidase N